MKNPGVRKRALLMQDVESLTDAWRLETGSDVFALHQEEVGPYIIVNKFLSGSTFMSTRTLCSPALVTAQSDASTLAREHEARFFLAKHSPNPPILSHT